jgi:hypothetical protein
MEASSEAHLRSDQTETMGSVIVEIRHPSDLDSDFASSQKASLAFDVDDVTGRNGNSAMSQFQNFISRLILYRHHPDVRWACRANKNIQTDVGNYS